MPPHTLKVAFNPKMAEVLHLKYHLRNDLPGVDQSAVSAENLPRSQSSWLEPPQ